MSSMSFHGIQFPPDISYGASDGPGYLTTVVTTVSGHERRNANWAAARGKWNVAHGLKKREQVAGPGGAGLMDFGSRTGPITRPLPSRWGKAMAPPRRFSL